MEGQNGNRECTFENRGDLEQYRLLFITAVKGMLEGWNGNGECTSAKVAKIEAFRYLPPHFHNAKIEVIIGATIRER